MAEANFGRHETTQARRELTREHMTDHAANIAWLTDVDLIPEELARSENPFYATSTWMVEKISDWVADTHNKLDYASTFDKHDLSGNQRVNVRETIRNGTNILYGPGFSGMAEIFAVVPSAALRDGIGDPEQWAELGLKAEGVGAGMARDGTGVQALIRAVLGGKDTIFDAWLLDPINFVIDQEEGLTTRIPLDTLVAAATEIVGEVSPHDSMLPCVALQAKIPEFGGETMFTMAWRSYAAFCRKALYRIEDYDYAASGSLPVTLDDATKRMRQLQYIEMERRMMQRLANGESIVGYL